MTARLRLPDRRQSLTCDVHWRGHVFAVSLGFDPTTGMVAEVFASAAKGGDLGALVSDACVQTSLLLQVGITAAQQRKSMAFVPEPASGALRAASVQGAILDVVIALENEWSRP